MNDLNDYGLYQFYTTTSTTTVRPYHRVNKKDDDVELDDTAPLPLLIGIGLALFIGFVILVLICCLCRRRRHPPATGERPVNPANYQRAPMADGHGGVAYPMTTVPPVSYPNSTVPYPPPPMGHPVQHNYGVIGGMNYNSAPHNQYPQQPPHFGGVPTFPPNQYIPSLPMAPHPVPHNTHSVSHSSQGSSVSGTTADPLVPPSSSASVQQHLQQQQHPHPHQPQFQPYPLHHHMSPPPLPPQQTPSSALQHHPHIQQQFMSGRQSPALHHPQMSYSAMLANEHHATQGVSPPMNTMVSMGTTTVTPSVTSPPLNRPEPTTDNNTPAMDQSTSYTDEEEEE